MAWDMKRYENVLRKQTGKAIRPTRFDGYANLINRYGTAKDDTEQYYYKPEPPIDDIILEMFYENNGLFARIIDTPAEEAVKHGFTLEGIEDDELTDFYQSAIDELDWEDVAMTGIKWARLFGGSLAVMLINDGHGLDEPVDWRHIKSIDDIVVYDRSMISPDRSSMYAYDADDPFRTRGSRLGTPEWYDISAPTGNFRVHDSRCLVFRNGVLPLNALNEIYQFWGIPEYVRISRAVRNAEIAHESAPKMLSKSVQPIYKMKDLAMELATEEGEDKVLRRLQIIDMARGLLNSIAIDSEGEDYSFQSFGFNGVSDVIESSCNWLSALTNIPQTILFGRSPAGMNATGHSDFENYYNYIERIQKRMLRANLRYLLAIIFTAGKHTGEIKEIPDKVDVQFNPLWSLDETEEAQLETAKLQNEQLRATVSQAYIEMGVIDPKEVRVELGKEDPVDPETMLDDMTEEELLESMPEPPQGGEGGEGGMGGMMGGGMSMMPQEGAEEAQQVSPENYAEQGNSPETAPEATKLPQDMNPEDEPDHEDAEGEEAKGEDLDWITLKNGVHVPLNPNGKAVGGPVEGATFPNAESKEGETSEESKSGETSNAPSATQTSDSARKPVEGKNIIDSYSGEKDIKSVIHAQGFDGLPRVVSQEDFDKAVKASNFVAQRVYSASSQEILNAYQDQLYNGEWYVECTEGGAEYGQGMYCDANYSGKITSGMKATMNTYMSDLSDEQELAVFDRMLAMKKELIAKHGEEKGKELYKSINRLSAQEFIQKYPEQVKDLDVPHSKIETFTLDPNFKVISYDELIDSQKHETRKELSKMDPGAYAALKGYDAIKAGDSDAQTAYTVILNRTKCLFLGSENRNDSVEGQKTEFKLGENGRINAIRDGKVIGWVIAQEGNGETGREDEDGDSQDPGGLIKSWGKPEYEPPLPLPGDEETTGWLVKDFDEIMSFVPDEGVSSPEWLDDEIKRRIRAVGVLVVDKNGKILTGTRKGGDGENFDLLGGPGGHVEPHESLEDAAIRETYEEFGIVAKNLTFVSLGDYEEDSGMIPAIFLCTEWAGTLHPVDGEMENLRFRTIDDILSHSLFIPFKTSLEILEKELTFEAEDGNIAMDEFVESDHPRAENGQFTSGGGTSSGSSETAKADTPKPSVPTAKEIRSRLIGQKTQDGRTVKSVSDHAVQRVQERKIGFDTIESLFKAGKVKPGRTPNTICYETDKHRVVLDKRNGKIVTVMHRGKKGGTK